MKPGVLICVSLLLAVLGSGRASGADERFPFWLPTDEPTAGITNLSFLNPQPANVPITVRDGHFFAANKPIRFWGVIMIGGCCFPEHEQASCLATRLAAMGLNLVRVHLIDGHYAPNGLFDPAYKGQLRILPTQLEKLDYLIAELKRRGIYVELPVNGYHWRNITGQTEFADLEPSKFSAFASGIPLWNARFLATEQQFARDFLGHVNPYTGKAYTEEPAVATVEIVNENGLICAWRGGHVRKAWPASMRTDLQQHWNQFLQSRYTTTDRLRAAWAVGQTQSDRKEMLRSSDLPADGKAWYLQVVKPSTAVLEPQGAGGPADGPWTRLTTQRDPQPAAFVLLQQSGFAIERGCRYCVSFFAKSETPADAPVKLNVLVSMNHAPWQNVGLVRQVEVTNTWHEVRLIFACPVDEPDAKLMLSPSTGSSRLGLARFSLRKVDRQGLLSDETLAGGKVPLLLAPDEALERTDAVAADFVDFLYTLDARYFRTMRDFLRHKLGCRHPIKGTQVDQYSSYFSQAECDFLDAHGYWEHPAFPHKPWDPRDWTIRNSPMVNRGGEVVVHLAGCRVRGKPYNISEYCHPAPSTYCSEEIPTVAAFGALQDWDGITFHCWHEWRYDWRRREMCALPPDRLDSFFNHARHPVKRVTMPFGALAFRRGDVAPARAETVLGVTRAEEARSLLDQKLSWQPQPVAASKGATWLDAFTHRLSLELGVDRVATLIPSARTRTLSDTGELAYDQGEPAGSVLTVNSPRAKAVIGFGAGRTFALGDVIVRPGPTRQGGFAVLTAAAVRGADFHTPGAAILVTATGYVENQGMGWNATRTSVGDQWGTGPVLCEGIPFSLTLKAPRATAWALDSRGRRASPIRAEAQPDGLRFTFGPAYKTLWYEIAVASGS